LEGDESQQTHRPKFEAGAAKAPTDLTFSTQTNMITAPNFSGAGLLRIRGLSDHEFLIQRKSTSNAQIQFLLTLLYHISNPLVGFITP